MMLLIASKDLNGDRLNGVVVQCVDCSSEDQTFRDSCTNLGRKYLAGCISGQNLVMLKVKIWKNTGRILSIFLLQRTESQIVS